MATTPNRLGFCPDCHEAVSRDDDHYRVTRDAEEEDLISGTTIYYHAECAPFGATSIDDEIDKKNRAHERGQKMRSRLLEGP